jgi:hypothetical protein
LRADHWCLVSAVIQDQLNLLDEYFEEDPETQETAATAHNSFGSKQGPVTFQGLETSHCNDTTFYNFRIHLSDFLSDFLPAHGGQLPNGKRIKFQPDDCVSGFSY